MRALLSLCGLLLVLLVVAKLAGTQLTSLTSAGSAQWPADAASQAPKATASERAAAQVKQAMEQGAALRADDAASR
jgi:hypothetical protein